MKKLLLTVIASLAFLSSSFAQGTNWPEFNDPDYETQTTVIAYVQLNGEFITDGYENYEVAPFVGDEVRGHVFLLDETDLGDLYPTAPLIIAHTAMGEVVTFKMYDHANGILYEDCTVNMEIITGEDHMEIWDGLTPDEGAVVISFTSGATTTITKTIPGYGTNFGWYLIGTPIEVLPANVGNMIPTDGDTHYGLFAFDQQYEGQEWRNYKAHMEEFTLVPTHGYIYNNSVGTELTFTFTGDPYTNTDPILLEYVDGKPFSGLNLLGNPYNHSVYLVDETGTTFRDFYIMNSERTDVILATSEQREIAALDGVFVLAEGEGEYVNFVENQPSKSPRFELNVTNGQTVVDRAAVRFGQGHTMPKYTMNDEVTKVYIPQFGKDYAVVSADEMGELPVNFKAAENGTYTIGFNTENVEFGYLHLIDNKTGNDIDLLETPNYTFDANRSDYASRFRLVFATGSNNSESFGFISDGNIILEGIDANTTVQVIDALGRILVSDKGVNTVSTDNMTPGVYMLRLVNGDNTKTQKIVVK